MPLVYVFGVLLVVALLLAAALLLNLGSRRATRVLDDVDLGEGQPLRIRGGLRWPLPGALGTTNTPPVLVELELFDKGIRVAPRWAWVRPFSPSWGARYDEIIVAEHARRGLRISKVGSVGVRFRIAAAGQPMIFLTTNPNRVLDALEAHDVAVKRDATVIHLWSNE
ncbi:MAG: hypothetical protein ABR925_08795 [Acidimicrobiales bacterium]|jgi:hypothetical protein